MKQLGTSFQSGAHDRNSNTCTAALDRRRTYAGQTPPRRLLRAAKSSRWRPVQASALGDGVGRRRGGLGGSTDQTYWQRCFGRRLLANTSTMLPINSFSDTPVITHKRFAADGQDRVKIRDMSLVGTPDPALRYHSSRGCRPAPWIALAVGPAGVIRTRCARRAPMKKWHRQEASLGACVTVFDRYSRTRREAVPLGSATLFDSACGV
jgi:hypothetical protein